MITNLGKLLVLLNAFVSVAVLSWAMSAYFNRQDPDQVADAAGEKLTDKVKRLNAELNTAQAAFGPQFAAVSAAEVRLDDVRKKIAARLQEAQDGVFYDIYEARAQGPDPADPTGLNRVRRILWGQLDKNRQVKGIDGTPLKGVTAMGKDLQDEEAKILAAAAAIRTKVDTSNALSLEINGHNARAARLKRIVEALVSETEYMADQRVIWDDRTASLQRRNRQLSTRLNQLTGGPKVEPATVAPPPAAALSVNPTR